MDTYPYNDQWKSTVDHCSEEWRSYCEAVACLRRYFRTKILLDKATATFKHNEYLDGLKKSRGAESIEKLRADFLLIGQHEGERVRAEVEQELLSQQAEVVA